MGERYWIGFGVSASFIVVAFFLSGFHHEAAWRWHDWRRRRKHGGMVW